MRMTKTLSRAAISRMSRSSIPSLSMKTKFSNLTTSRKLMIHLHRSQPTLTTTCQWIQCIHTWCQRKTRYPVYSAPTNSWQRQTHRAPIYSTSQSPSTRTVESLSLAMLSFQWKTWPTWFSTTIPSREATSERTKKLCSIVFSSFMELHIASEQTASLVKSQLKSPIRASLSISPSRRPRHGIKSRKP